MKPFAISCRIVFVLASILILSCAKQNSSSQRDYILQKSDSIISSILLPTILGDTVFVTEFGAKGDSITDCKLAFDQAILTISEAGGGVIMVPTGIYTINGPLHLKSNINLHLQKGVKIRFGSNPQDYLPNVLTSWEGTFVYNYSPFIYAINQKNISITGKGVIDGEASNTWNNWRGLQREDQLKSREYNHNNIPVDQRIFGEGHFLRPHLIQFYKCENILIDSVRIEDSPFWCIHLLMSKNITVRNISFDAQNKNNDGVDPEYSQNILIENVNFNNADDNVAIKAGRDHEGRSIGKSSNNIVVRNCNFKGLHALVIGSEMSAGVNNVFVYDCDYSGYTKRGVYLKSNSDRGGEMHDLYFSNISFGEVLDCFFITSNYKNEGEGFPTSIYNVYLEDIYCKKANEYGINISGSNEIKVKNVQLKNIRIDSAAKSLKIENVENLNFDNVTINGQLVNN